MTGEADSRADFSDQTRGGYNACSAWLGGVAIGTLRAWVSRGEIPHHRLGPRLVYFERSEVERWAKGRDLLYRRCKS